MVRFWTDRGRWTGGRKDPTLTLLILWTILVVYVTMLPFDFSLDTATDASRVRALVASLGRRVWPGDAVRNVLFFVPLGLLLSFRLAGGGTGFGKTLVRAASVGLALSIVVECGQFFLPSRIPSLVDLATNTFGAALGASVGWPLIRRAWPRYWPALRRFVGRRPMSACALAALVGLSAAGLAPSKVGSASGDTGASMGPERPMPLDAAVSEPAPSARPWLWAEEGLAWTLAGGLVTLALKERGWSGSRAIASAVALCGTLGLAIASSALLIPGGTVDPTSVLFKLIGSAAGATAVAGLPAQDPRRWTGPALSIWGIAVLLSAWTPPHPASPSAWSIGPSQLVPFWSFYRRTDVSALAHLCGQVLRFVPLGALLAARDARQAPRRALVLGLALGLVLEVGQSLLTDRAGEITDALSAGVGAVVGARLWGWGASIRAQESGLHRYRVR
jgi:glycopeptide antibiotics resistance protein